MGGSLKGLAIKGASFGGQTTAIASGDIWPWALAIEDIQDGWVLCDGNNGTPNLTETYIIGAGDTYNPDDTGGSFDHTHTWTPSVHNHNLGFQPPTQIANVGGRLPRQPDNRSPGGMVTGATDLHPPTIFLNFIMKT